MNNLIVVKFSMNQGATIHEVLMNAVPQSGNIVEIDGGQYVVKDVFYTIDINNFKNNEIWVNLK